MTIQVEVSPEVQARLAEQAEARGMALGHFAGQILEDNVRRYPVVPGKLTPEMVEDLSRRLSEGSESLPILPPEVNNRESYYEDRW